MKKKDIELWTVYENDKYYVLFYRGANGTEIHQLGTVGVFHGLLVYPKVMEDKPGGWSLLDVLNRDYSQTHVMAIQGYYENIFNKVIPNFTFGMLVGWNTTGESNTYVYCCDTAIHFSHLKKSERNISRIIGKYKIRTR